MNHWASTTLVPYGSSSGMLASLSINHDTHIPQYHYWWELNLAVEPKITIATVLANFNLGVRYGIAIRMYIHEYEILVYFNLAVTQADHQTAKFNSPPNFLAIQYIGMRGS